MEPGIWQTRAFSCDKDAVQVHSLLEAIFIDWRKQVRIVGCFHPHHG